MSMGTEVHDLLARPYNGSLVLGAAHHLLYRPVNALIEKAFGTSVPRALDPEHWGEQAARLGEKVDYSLAPPGSTRRDTLVLDNKHLLDIGSHLDSLHASDRSAATGLEESLNSVVRKHYNSGENIRSLAEKAKADPGFAATLHGVEVPSLTGEVGRFAKTMATDAATMVGASAIMDKLRHGSRPEESEKRGSRAMSNRAIIIESLNKAASLLEAIPVKQRAFKQANKLVEAGAIPPSELNKYASILERNSDSDAQALIAGLLRDEFKSASTLGEVVGDDNPSRLRFSTFDQACLDAHR